MKNNKRIPIVYISRKNTNLYFFMMVFQIRIRYVIHVHSKTTPFMEFHQDFLSGQTEIGCKSFVNKFFFQETMLEAENLTLVVCVIVEET